MDSERKTFKMAESCSVFQEDEDEDLCFGKTATATDLAANGSNGNENEVLLQKHRKELRELQASIQKMKKSISKGDKKAKKKITQEIALLEDQLSKRHAEELDNIKSCVAEVKEIESANENADKQSKVSRAQKRREKKEAETKLHEERLKEGEREALTSDRTIEIKHMTEKLSKLGLEFKEIPADGDCLYNAIADQLRLHQSEIKMRLSAEKLRETAAEYMRRHSEQFIPFMITGDEIPTEESFNTHCDKVATTKLWGGQMEISALSDALQYQIIVHQADTPDIVTGDEHSATSIHLSYHQHHYGLGAHYNSVVTKTIYL